MTALAMLAPAAQFERDRRAAAYPRLIAAGDLDADKGQLDWQAWVAIADWLETGRNRSIFVWSELEQAASVALDSIAQRLAKAQAAGDPPDQLDTLAHRYAGLVCIHRALGNARAMTDRTADLRRALVAA